MKFKEYLTEFFNIKSSPEMQNTDSKNDAREISKLTRGKMPGKYLDSNGSASNSPFNADIKQDTQDKSKMSLILKNTAEEVVFVNKDQSGDLFITLVNKMKSTKRTIALDKRGSLFLKRFI